MKNILLPTDFSGTSYNAAVFALDLFGTKDVRYTLLNVFLKPAYRNFLMSLNVDTEQASRNGLRRMERRIRKLGGTMHLALRSSFEPLDNAIGELHEAGRADLVVMGTQGEGNYGTVGHNTALAITGARVPVIAVPAQWIPGPVQRILLADDGEGMDADMVRPLVQIAKRTKAHVEVVHVRPEGTDDRYSDRKALMKTLLTDVPHDFTLLTGSKVEEALDDLAMKQGAQLVAVVRRNRGIIERLLKGSHAKRMALHTAVPLLVLREAR
ncbi:MAG: universal stress protein [Flavobacteriales bacterium]|nr:universal stress protein [Flavobacteriales bacterium]MCL4281153.1 universal stress protein [Flavobacteriales bacterium]